MSRQALLGVLEAARLTSAHNGFIQLVVDHQRIHLGSELQWMDALVDRVSSDSNIKKGEGHELA